VGSNPTGGMDVGQLKTSSHAASLCVACCSVLLGNAVKVRVESVECMCSD